MLFAEALNEVAQIEQKKRATDLYWLVGWLVGCSICDSSFRYYNKTLFVNAP